MEASRDLSVSRGKTQILRATAKYLPQIGNQQARPNYLFANNIRFLSMAAIVAVHSIDCSLPILGHNASLPYLDQPFKFGTIAFFLVSGFLFGDRIDQCSSLDYFGRRLRNVFLPWLVWFLIYGTICTGADLVRGRFAWHGIGFALNAWNTLLLGSPFWFVPNLMFALALLLIFRRVLKDVRIGILFLLGSLFYGVNIYGHWIGVLHTRAVFGFVFYLWLGAWSSWHFSSIEKWLARIPMFIMLALVFVTLCLSLMESRVLVGLASESPTNTLRISNQLYSIAVVLAIVKLRKPTSPRFMNTREHTFGIYLTHSPLLTVLCPLLKRTVKHFPVMLTHSDAVSMVMIVVTFILTYAGCLFLVRTLLATPWLRWSVGLASRAVPRGTDGTLRHERRDPLKWEAIPGTALVRR